MNICESTSSVSSALQARSSSSGKCELRRRLAMRHEPMQLLFPGLALYPINWWRGRYRLLGYHYLLVITSVVSHLSNFRLRLRLS